MIPTKDSAPGRAPGPAANGGKPRSALNRLAGLARPRLPAAWRERFDAFWSARNPREQWILAGGAAVLLAVAGYSLLWEPAADASARLARSLPQQRADLAEMDTLAQEARSLNGSPPPALQGDALTQALQAGLAQQGLKATRLATNGDGSVQVQLDKVPFGALAAWLQDVRQQQRLKVTDARLSYVGATALVNMTATLQGPTAGGQR
ncbi:type II secretion system protein M [Cupriavidus malaysiensis]|uniref:General secretion pathway protein GspM n=1 Tax=Cupriavidus malaysiensis TaxID=367825 RepID=A0ABM6EZA2_9BURK|nr:general secretion pathway protein GspM [Cupriavidus malaysiensis]